MNPADAGIFRSLSNESFGLVLLPKGPVDSIDKGSCVIYLLGPQRLKGMSGNKASSYFLAAVQTCIDRDLALPIKNEAVSGLRQSSAVHLCFWACLCAT